jgi:hypothetical protein
VTHGSQPFSWPLCIFVNSPVKHVSISNLRICDFFVSDEHDQGDSSSSTVPNQVETLQLYFLIELAEAGWEAYAPRIVRALANLPFLQRLEIVFKTTVMIMKLL